MNAPTDELLTQIRLHRDRLEAVHEALESALGNEIQRLGRTSVSALVVAGLLDNYYTCTETVLLRISQHFENRLSADRWHRDLLERMNLEIEGVRAAVVSDAALAPLLELLRFRHFKRYYFEMEYDWDRMDFLITKLRQAHPLVQRDLERFEEFLRALERPHPPGSRKRPAEG